MDDPEVEAIRNARMKQMQQQYVSVELVDGEVLLI